MSQKSLDLQLLHVLYHLLLCQQDFCSMIKQKFKIQSVQDAYHYCHFYAFLKMLRETSCHSSTTHLRSTFSKVASSVLNEYLAIFAEVRPLPNSACWGPLNFKYLEHCTETRRRRTQKLHWQMICQVTHEENRD